MKPVWRWSLGLGLAAAVAISTWRYIQDQPSLHLSPAATQALAADGMTPLGSRVAPGFTLTAQDGKPVTLADFRGKAVILTFLDPVCWIDCPLQAQEMKQVDALLGPSLAGQVALLAVVANPLYHSLADVQGFDRQEGLSGVPNWTYATSSSVARLRQVWQAYYEDVSVPPNGMVTHTDLFYLIDPSGRMQYMSNPEADPNYLMGTSQLLATYVLRVLHQSVPLRSLQARMPATVPSRPITEPGPVAVHFASAADGYLVMNAPPYQVLYATTDGGVAWTDVGPPGITKRGGLAWAWAGPSAAWIVVRPYGWMQDTSAYVTTSAGRAWGTPAILPAAPSPAATLPLAAAGPTAAGALVGDRLWTTEDAGQSWSPVANLPPQVVEPGLGFAPGPVAWLAGRVPTPGGARLWLLRGASWQGVNLPVPTRFQGLPVVTLPPSWQSAEDAIALVVASQGTSTWVWADATADGGRRWQQALPPLAALDPLAGGVQVAGTAVYALASVPGGVAVWTGASGTGRWAQLGSRLPAAAQALDFLDGQRGWVVGTGAKGTTLWATSDAGRQWVGVPLPG